VRLVAALGGTLTVRSRSWAGSRVRRCAALRGGWVVGKSGRCREWGRESTLLGPEATGHGSGVSRRGSSVGVIPPGCCRVFAPEGVGPLVVVGLVASAPAGSSVA
jgi:hypothetical protein